VSQPPPPNDCDQAIISAAHQRLLLDAAPDATVTVDQGGRILLANARVEGLLGYSPEEVVGRPVEMLVPERLRDLHRADRDAFAARPQTRQMGVGLELMARRKDGHELPVEISLSPIRLADQLVVVAALRDVSDRRRTEAVLKRQAALLDLAPSAIIVRDFDGVISFWNPAAEQLYGWRSAEALGRVTHELLDTRFPVSLDALNDALLDSGSWKGELRHRRRDGAELLVASRMVLQRDGLGQPLAVLEIDQDITENRRTEQALLESEEWLRLLIDRIEDYAIFRLTPEGNVASWNAGAARLKGYQAEEIVGRHFSVFYPEEAVRAGEPARLLARAEADGRVENEGWRVRKDGSRFWADVVITVLRDQSGRARGFAKVSRDVTERRQAEERLRQTAAELARSNADLEQFAYVASHDLQAPLRSVTSYSQLLSRRYAGRLDADADEFISFMAAGARRMQSLIDDLLAYARVGSAALVRVPTDLGALVDQVIADARMVDDQAAITRGALPTLSVDPRQVSQVFQNLLGNALKYHGPEPTRVEVSAERDPTDWVFSMRDNGIGIDPAQAERIFLIFQRLHAQADYDGTGLGLAICKRVVERHGGRIWVESEPGSGATFRFTLPAA
jgi:PAS domain S-box-containing protein